MHTDTRGAWLLLLGGAAVIVVATLVILYGAHGTAIVSPSAAGSQHAAVRKP